MAPVVEQLLRLTPARLYFVRIAPNRVDYGVLLCLIGLIGALSGTSFWASYGLSGARRRVLEAPLAFLGVMSVTHFLYLHLSRYPPLWNAVAVDLVRLGLTAFEGWFVVSFIVGLAVVAVFASWPSAWRTAKPLLCGGAGVVWLTAASAIWHPPAATLTPDDATRPRLLNVHELGPGNPVVWVILDEWDYDLTYGRADRKVFPELDRLRQQAVFLENVRAAGNITLVAIPGLLLGRPVRDYHTTAPAAARFLSTGVSEAFPGPQTIFDTAAQFGYQSHIVGWYHPYCRIFGSQVASCWWDDLMLPSLRPGADIGTKTVAFLRDSIELESLPLAGPSNALQRQIARVGPMVELASRAASHPGRSLSFLHLPLPHAPFFRLDANGSMQPLATAAAGYEAGLDAADRAVGSLRTAMEHANVWENALVIVTSDHPYRYQLAGGYGNGHIPMLIKFPHQNSAVIYSHPFQAVETRNLIEDFIQGKLATPERAVAWLDQAAPRPVSMTQLDP